MRSRGARGAGSRAEREPRSPRAAGPTGLLSDDEFALFQGFLFSNPKAGAVIQDTGGLRKVRWAIKGRGKSGGVRVIYFYLTATVQIRLIAIYKKGIKDDLNAAEKKS